MALLTRPTSLLPLLDNEEIQFVFVGGKGGVGKTTSSSAIAVQFAKRRPKDRILLISTDPAHNLSDAFCQQFSGNPEQVRGVDNLWACEVDPATAIEKDVADIKEAAAGGATSDGGNEMVGPTFPPLSTSSVCVLLPVWVSMFHKVCPTVQSPQCNDSIARLETKIDCIGLAAP